MIIWKYEKKYRGLYENLLLFFEYGTVIVRIIVSCFGRDFLKKLKNNRIIIFQEAALQRGS